MSLVAGLTGGIGSGKSTIANLFEQHGAGIIDTDAIAHNLTQPGGAAIAAIRDSFGDGYITPDGALDRVKMRTRIFTDSAAKQQLEAILHPLILEQTKVLLQQMQAYPYIVIVVPLLPESPAYRQLVQRILVVDCDENIQVERVVKRSGMNTAEVLAIIAQQTQRTERLSLADDVIRNDGDMDRLAVQVAVLHKKYAGSQNGI